MVAKFLRDLSSVQIHVAPVCGPANAGKKSWRIIYVLVLCQGVSEEMVDVVNAGLGADLGLGTVAQGSLSEPFELDEDTLGSQLAAELV